jgi:hypothetical protein
MPLPRKITRTPEQNAAAQAFADQQRQELLARAPAEARRWIVYDVAEVKVAWLTARDKGDRELQKIYAEALTTAGERNPLNYSGRWE